MKIIVQKFGGTSVATAECRESAMERVIKAKEDGYAPVVVVSAMGRKGEPYATDTLIETVRSIDRDVEAREMDLLISCGEIISTVVMAQSLKAKGHPAVAMTGGQAGINTDSNFGNASIVNIDPQSIINYLAEGKIVIVAGFQGVCADGSVTTLGRGGSDTTATALGGALQADVVEIYTDVDGVMTTDPRILPEAHILEGVTYKEICEMAHQGAKVIHPRAVEIAMQRNIPLRIKSTFSDAPGTLVTNMQPDMGVGTDIVSDRLIAGIAHTPNVTQIRVTTVDVPDVRQADKKIFKAMALADISVDFISVQPEAVLYTVRDDIADKAIKILQNMGFSPEIVRGCAKVSIVGAGIAGVPGVMADMVESLSEAGVTILQSADSHTTIWVLVHKEDMVAAVQALHKRFNLGV